jgi:hypothetical protein
VLKAVLVIYKRFVYVVAVAVLAVVLSVCGTLLMSVCSHVRVPLEATSHHSMTLSNTTLVNSAYEHCSSLLTKLITVCVYYTLQHAVNTRSGYDATDSWATDSCA